MIIIPKNFIETSFSLSALGVGNLAWKRKDILKLIKDDCLSEKYILGGDVLEITHSNEIKHTYDNWSIDKKNFENYFDFIKRSKLETEKYILRYNENNRNIIYALVLSEQIPVDLEI